MRTEINLADDVVLVKDGARTWQVRFFCPKMGTWHWSPPFQASTKQAAAKNCRPHLVRLVEGCAERFRVDSVSAFESFNALSARVERLGTTAGWE